MQVKLLRVLEDREVRRVGAIKSRTIDVRFVAATNRDLEAEIASRRFREDLYYRLSGFVLRVPPLRDRRAEIPAFARAFLEIACAASGRPHVPELSAEALDLLGAYRWPGNLRELRNVIDRALILCDDDAITPEHLPVDKMGTALDAGARAAADVDAGLKGDVAKLERERIVEALEASDGNQTRAAKRLGISRGTLLARMDAFGLDRPRRGKPR